MPLVDVALPNADEAVITDILGDYQVSGSIIGYHKLRTRQAGAERHVDLHVQLPGNLNLSTVHSLSDSIEKDIKEKLANTSIVIHMEPCCNEDKDCNNCEYRKSMN